MTINKESLGIVKFSGNSSNPFAGENFSFEISNNQSEATDVKIALCKGWFQNASEIKDYEGAQVDYILADGTLGSGTSAVTVAGKACKVSNIVSMFTHTPCRLKGLKLSVDNSAQLDEEIQILMATPSGYEVIKRIIPSSYKNEDNNDDKRVSIDLTDEQIWTGSDIVIILNVAKGRKMYVTTYVENRASFRKMVQYNVENA